MDIPPGLGARVLEDTSGYDNAENSENSEKNPEIPIEWRGPLMAIFDELPYCQLSLV